VIDQLMVLLLLAGAGLFALALLGVSTLGIICAGWVAVRVRRSPREAGSLVPNPARCRQRARVRRPRADTRCLRAAVLPLNYANAADFLSAASYAQWYGTRCNWASDRGYQLGREEL